MIQRGDLFWIDFGPADGSTPAKRRPVLVIQSDGYNQSRIATTIVAVLTSNLDLADWPGNVFIPATTSGLPKDSVVNVTQLATLDKTDLYDRAGRLPLDAMRRVDGGLSQVLSSPV